MDAAELKAALLALLDDPDVRAKLREAMMDGRVHLPTQIEVPVGTSPDAVKRAVAAVVEPVVARDVRPGWLTRLPHEKPTRG